MLSAVHFSSVELTVLTSFRWTQMLNGPWPASCEACNRRSHGTDPKSASCRARLYDLCRIEKAWLSERLEEHHCRGRQAKHSCSSEFWFHRHSLIRFSVGNIPTRRN